MAKKNTLLEGFTNTVGSAVRSFFARSSQHQAAQIQRGGSPSVEKAGLPYNLVSQFGYDSLAQHLRVDQDLQARYTDAEEMDEYPEIATALDIYADDSTIPDMEENKSIWVTSENQSVSRDLNEMLHKRVQVENDVWGVARTVAKYGNCLPVGTRVWTTDGLQSIESIEPGTRVMGRREDGSNALFEVVKRYENGTKSLFRVRTRHRELVATGDHPLLVDLGDGRVEWRKVSDLEVIRYPSGGVSRKTPNLVVATRAPDSDRVPSWDELFDVPDDSSFRYASGSSRFKLPSKPTPWLMRLLGFMWGDGYLATERLDNESVSVLYARGVYEDQNDYYDDLLARLYLVPDMTRDRSATVVHSIKFKVFLLACGFTNGATAKRLPSWVTRLPWEHRKAFLDGFMDADGWSSEPATWNQKAYHFEIANVPLARDMKNLIDGLGYRSGQLRIRHREIDEIAGNPVRSTSETATLTFSLHEMDGPFVSERLLSVEEEGEGDVYDIEVDDDAHNFVAEGVVVHNCYGEMLVSDQGVLGMSYLSTPTVRRVEGPRGELIGFIQDVRGEFNLSLEDFYKLAKQRGTPADRNRPPGDLTVFEDWEMVHWRLRGKHLRSVYGHGVVDPARWIWKRLALLEDALLIYKLSRAPARYAFYVDVGDLDHERGLAFVNRVKNQFVKKKFVNPSTGKIDMRHNPLAHDEDFFVPMREGRESTRIEVLQGPDYAEVDTVEYHRDKLVAALKTPKSYMGYGGEAARNALSTEDIRFARTVMRIQREICQGYRQVCRVHLIARGMSQAQLDQYDYNVQMSVPSAIMELARLEVMSATADLAMRLGDYVGTKYVLTNLFKFSEEEAVRVMKQRDNEKIDSAKVEGRAQQIIQKAAMPPGGGQGMEFASKGAPRGTDPLLERRLSKLIRSELKSWERDFEGKSKRSKQETDDRVRGLLSKDPALRRRFSQMEGLLSEIRASQRQLAP